MTADETGFAKWLANWYRPRSITKTVADLRTYLRDPKVLKRPLTDARYKDYERATKLYNEYATEASDGYPNIVRKVPEIPPRERTRKRHIVKARPISIDDAEWKKLVRLLDDDESPEGAALAVMTATGLRVSDVLRVSRKNLFDGLRRTDGIFVVELKGGKEVLYPVMGAETSWERLRALFLAQRDADTVAALIAPSSDDPEANGPAYHAVRRRYREVCKEAGVTGRHNLHRIRKTVANRLQQRDVPMEVIQQLLGHADIRTTQGYANERMTGRITEALEKLRKR